MGMLDGMVANGEIKVVGKRRLASASPQEYLQRAACLQKSLEQLNPFPRPRGFVFKARSWDEYEQWRRSQSNPRLW
jgi:hypothetical protein